MRLCSSLRQEDCSLKNVLISRQQDGSACMWSLALQSYISSMQVQQVLAVQDILTLSLMCCGTTCQVYLGSFFGRRWYLPSTSIYTRYLDRESWHMPEKVKSQSLSPFILRVPLLLQQIVLMTSCGIVRCWHHGYCCISPQIGFRICKNSRSSMCSAAVSNSSTHQVPYPVPGLSLNRSAFCFGRQSTRW